MKTPLQMAFDKWLEENNAQAAVLIKAPLGGQVTPENFIPQGWGCVILIVPKEPKPTNGDSA